MPHSAARSRRLLLHPAFAQSAPPLPNSEIAGHPGSSVPGRLPGDTTAERGAHPEVLSSHREREVVISSLEAWQAAITPPPPYHARENRACGPSVTCRWIDSVVLRNMPLDVIHVQGLGQAAHLVKIARR